MLSYFYDPSMFMYRSNSNFLEKVVLEREHGGGDALLTGKNNGFPFLDIFEYLKNTHKNPKFGKVRQVPLPNLGFLWVFFKYPKISTNGNLLFFPVSCALYCMEGEFEEIIMKLEH